MKKTFIISSFILAAFTQSYAQQSIEGFEEAPSVSLSRFAEEAPETPTTEAVAATPVTPIAVKPSTTPTETKKQLRRNTENTKDREALKAEKAEKKTHLFNQIVALVLAFPFFPMMYFGIHRFYMGYTTEGLLFILFTVITLGIVSFIWGTIDFIRIAIGDLPY